MQGRAGEVTLLPPKSRPSGGEPITASVVLTQQSDPDINESALTWVILTSEDVSTSTEQAALMVLEY